MRGWKDCETVAASLGGAGRPGGVAVCPPSLVRVLCDAAVCLSPEGRFGWRDICLVTLLVMCCGSDGE